MAEPTETLGKQLYYAIKLVVDPESKLEWDNAEAVEKQHVEKIAQVFSAPMLARITELEKRVTELTGHGEVAGNEWDAKPIPWRKSSIR